MSFGYSAGDFIICIQLARQVLEEYQQAPQEFQAATTDVAGLQLVLNDVKDSIDGSELSPDKQQDLQGLLNGCNQTLKELLQVLEKFKSLATSSHRRWEKFRWDKDRVERMRLRIVSNVGLLTAFNFRLLSSSQDRIEKLLLQLTQQSQSLTVSGGTLESVSRGNEEAWLQLGAELEGFGISPIMVRAHRDIIIAWILNTLNEGESREDMSGTTVVPGSSPGHVPSEHSRGKRPADGGFDRTRTPGADILKGPSHANDAALAFQEHARMPIKRRPAVRRRRNSGDEQSTNSDTEHLLAPRSNMPEAREDVSRRWSLAAFKDLTPAEGIADNWQRLRRNGLCFTASHNNSVETVIPASFGNGNRCSYTFTDPPRTRYRRAGITKLEGCFPDDLLQGNEIDQLQLYLLGVITDAFAPSAYVVYHHPSQGGTAALKGLIARYRCKHSGCDTKWRDTSEYKVHQRLHTKLFQCQKSDCRGKDGFSSNIDLIKHLQSVHGHIGNGDLRGFACAADFCPRKDKVWQKEENYRLHCLRVHQEEDCDDLVSTARIYLCQPAKR